MGLPVYNGLPFVKNLLDCLLLQTFSDFELVISDNASDDGTEELCREYAARDPRIRYHRNAQNIGLIPNFNRVFELARAPYYKWMAADDLLEPTYLEVCLPPVRDDATVSVSHCQTLLVDDAGLPLPYTPRINASIDPFDHTVWLLDRDGCATRGSKTRRFREVLFQQIMCGPIYGIMPRAMLLKTGLHKSFFGSDKLLLAELALHGRFVIAPQRLFKKRMHKKMTSRMSGEGLQSRIDPSLRLGSQRLTKLRAYLAMLKDVPELTMAERQVCHGHLMLHALSMLVPERLRYRPEWALHWLRERAWPQPLERPGSSS
jgi:glycosyltransferase involved in cell wall biosynthesis